MSLLEFGLALCMGIGLSAAVGFRIFIPLLIVNLASLTGYLTLSDDFSWLGTYPALIVLLIATVVEILAYYIPAVDNLLDTISTPLALIAGTILTASFISEMNPLLTWGIATISGGSTATVSNIAMATVRGVSTTTTAGFGNFLVSTFELITSALMSLLAIILPIVSIILVIMLGFILYRMVKKLKTRKMPFFRKLKET